MTANQISYAKFSEDARHNREMEAYNSRIAAVQERNANTQWQSMLVAANQVSVNAAQVSESMRHNYISEQQNEQHLINEGINAGSGVVGTIGKVIGAIANFF